VSARKTTEADHLFPQVGCRYHRPAPIAAEQRRRNGQRKKLELRARVV